MSFTPRVRHLITPWYEDCTLTQHQDSDEVGVGQILRDGSFARLQEVFISVLLQYNPGPCGSLLFFFLFDVA